MSDREQIRKRLKEDNIEFLLVQFVDMHGAAKVKMVPRDASTMSPKRGRP